MPQKPKDGAPLDPSNARPSPLEPPLGAKNNFQNGRYEWTDYSEFEPDRGGVTPHFIYRVIKGKVTASVDDVMEVTKAPTSIEEIRDQVKNHIEELEEDLEKAQQFLRVLGQPGLEWEEPEAKEAEEPEDEDE